MVENAARLDPAILMGWSAGLRVRVPPASNEKSVARIGHLVDLQSQAKGRRARAVIVVGAYHADIQSVIDQVIARCSATETVLIFTDIAELDVKLPHTVREVDFSQAMPRMKQYRSDRTLVEFIRSLRPEFIVNLNAALMNRAMRVHGRAVAASSVVYQFLPFGVAEPQECAKLGRRYYRAVDLKHRVIVSKDDARDYLVQTFALPPRDHAAIWVAQGGTGQMQDMTGAADA
jgi:hypothetical protein